MPRRKRSKLQEIADKLPPDPVDQGDDAPADAAADAAVNATAAPAEPGNMALICRLPVMTLGAALCKRYGVPPLDASETEAIADALAAVLSAHGVTVKDPRIVAWLTFGGAVAMAAHPRLEFYVANQATLTEPAPEPDADKKPDAVAA